MAGEQRLALILVSAIDAPMAETEYKFHPKRRWRIDLAWPQLKIALEIEGGVWTKGRHTRGSGFIKDMEKYNELALLGWRLFRVTHQQIDSGDAIKLMERVFEMTATWDAKYT